jgi:hypothetical protein
VHTDEFEISLFRELQVCRNTLSRIKKTLDLMERKHRKSTEMFIEELRRGERPSDAATDDEFIAWRAAHESLLLWQDLERRYQEQFLAMKL